MPGEVSSAIIGEVCRICDFFVRGSTMKKRLMVYLGILPLLMLASCSGSPEKEAATPPSPPTGQASPPPVVPPVAASPAVSPVPTPPAISSQAITAMGLIPSTNPQQRLKEVQQARNNPFGLIPIIPIVQGNSNTLVGNKPGGKTGQNIGGNLNLITGDKGKQTNISLIKQVVPITNRVGSGGFCRGQAKDQGSVKVKESKLNLLPEKAYQIEVSGIIDFPSGKAVAIVKDSSQPVSQYVTSGSRLANGLVLVKSIDISSQQITLQQQGFEQAVYRAVGQPAEKVSSTFTPSKIEVQPPGPDGFGIYKNIMLDKVSLGVVNTGEAGNERTQTRLYGTLCNDGKKTIELSSVKIQIQDAQSNNILDATWNSITKTSRSEDTTGTSVEIMPGQKVEFDFEIPKLRDRERGKVYVKFLRWR